MCRHKERGKAVAVYGDKAQGREAPLSAQPLRKTDPPVPQSMDNYFDNDNFVPQHLIGLLK